MKAIRTRYIGPTAQRPARIIADDGDGNRVTIPADGIDWTHSEQAHAKAAIALCDRMRWSYEAGLVHGQLGIYHVFTFLMEDERNVYAANAKGGKA